MSAPLVRDVLHVAEEMTTRLDELARVTSRALAREVSRSAVVRAAVLAWLDAADRERLGGAAEAIRAAAQRSAVRLRRYPQRWPEELAARLEAFARRASAVLACKVSRSVVVRVAVAVWLDAAPASPAAVTEAIRAELVPRGRKAQR
jgi:predicted transcriptional regulator